MITAKKLQTLITLTPAELTKFLKSSGYKRDTVTECQFLGLTNGNQFCYKIDYDNFGVKEYRKAFLTYNPAQDQVIADIS